MKYVAEPHMHSMPAVTVHPNGKSLSLSLFLSPSSPISCSFFALFLAYVLWLLVCIPRCVSYSLITTTCNSLASPTLPAFMSITILLCTHTPVHAHSGKWLACQSMDNKIMIYGVHNNFRLNRKKSFRGHMVAGYACQVDFSPDGRYDLLAIATCTCSRYDQHTHIVCILVHVTCCNWCVIVFMYMLHVQMRPPSMHALHTCTACMNTTCSLPSEHNASRRAPGRPTAPAIPKYMSLIFCPWCVG